MTKTLTEQWREGTLPAGYYYIIANTKARNQVIFYLPENTNTDGAVIKGEVVNGEDGGWVVEVLGPVPSYQTWKEFQQYFVDSLELEVKLKKAYEELEKQSIEIVGLKTEKEQLVSKTEQLEKQLSIATKALKEYAELNIVGEEAREALKEMEGVK